VLRLRCLVCATHPTITSRQLIQAHVAGHKLIGDAVQVYWATANGLVLRALIEQRRHKSRSERTGSG
jgi:hypothetical protein